MYYDEKKPARSGCQWVAIAATVAAVVQAVLFYIFIGRIAGILNPFENGAITNPRAPAPTESTIDRPAVVQQVRSLNRLEAATAVIQQVVTAGQRGNALYNLLRGDQLLLIAHGEVVAGFDLTKLGPDDITISDDGAVATVTLPPAEILYSRLDNERTQVYDRETGIFAKGDPNLESEARRVAEQQIVQAACESGILARAVEDGKRNIENLVKAFGVDEVIVNATEGTCEVTE